MGETERLTVEAISELQEKIATQREVICNLNAMNDELQAKVDKIEQIVERFKSQYDHTSNLDLMVEIKEVLEKE